MIRRRAWLRGIVQGVGFRPHVARLAARYQLTGFCGNDDVAVFVEAQGDMAVVEAFYEAVNAEAPPLARILESRYTDIEINTQESGFRIVESRRAAGAVTLIPPDLAPCADCLAEMADPADRRFGYPFITCTNCGPRLSIIRDVPYDRPLTTMADFPLCDRCRLEYEDPADRRYHAQPISCYDCGPTLWLELPVLAEAEVPESDSDHRTVAAVPESVPARRAGAKPESVPGRRAGADGVTPTTAHPSREETAATAAADRRTQIATTLADAKERLALGQILAVKGIGGFTLMCDARNADAIALLRQRKRRPDKPFAVMAGSLAAAQAIATISASQAAELAAPQRPILLLPKSAGYDLAEAVAPRLDDVGIMLASAPLHHLLLEETDVFIATSANISGEPLAYDNDEARQRLGSIVDAFLMHNRGIHVPVEDSVLLATLDPLDGPRASAGEQPPAGEPGRPGSSPGTPADQPPGSRPRPESISPVRRSRGYAPLPLLLPEVPDPPTVLAVGGEWKNTFALTRDGMAFLSPHIGDMSSLVSQQAFDRHIAQQVASHRRQPQLVVADRHPDYATTAWAERYSAGQGIPLLQVQHHHAHALSLLAEHRLVGQPLVTVVYDGTGYGDDNTIWGGEILALGENPLDYRRLWHLPTFPLAGGDAAIEHPWRIALGLLHHYGIDPAGLPPLMAASPKELELVRWQLATGVGVVMTSSAGRLFDAIASLLDVCHHISYEAQAAMELEVVARTATALAAANPTTVILRERSEVAESTEDLGSWLAGFVQAIREGGDRAELARDFHYYLATLTAAQLQVITDQEPTQSESGERLIGLTGGVAANSLFSADLRTQLATWGASLLTHQQVPPNDGGLSLGQALAGYLALRDPAQSAGPLVPG